MTETFDFIVDTVKKSVRTPSGYAYSDVMIDEYTIKFVMPNTEVQKDVTRWSEDPTCRSIAAGGREALTNLERTNNPMFQWCAATVRELDVPGRYEYSINRITGDFSYQAQELRDNHFEFASGRLMGECKVQQPRF